jgi:WD40 repeat protein
MGLEVCRARLLQQSNLTTTTTTTPTDITIHRSGGVTTNYAGHRDTVFDLAYSSGVTAGLVTAGADGFVRHFDAASGALLHERRAAAHALLCLQTLDDGRVVLSGGMDKQLVASVYKR